MKVGIIGTGNIAGAIVSGALRNEVVHSGEIFAFDALGDKCEEFCGRHGANPCQGISEVIGSSDFIVLSVKPQNYPDVLSEAGKSAADGKVFISVAAGISIDYIKSFLGNEAHVVRVMPNTPLLIGQGATALCRDTLVTDEEFDAAKSLFECGGKTAVLDESVMNAVISVNGSSPAYLFLFAKAVCDYAESVGIDRETAKMLFAQTMVGSAAMLTQSGDDIDTLIKNVTSKGGTTAKALEVFENKGFEDCIKEAMAACTKRADELGS